VEVLAEMPTRFPYEDLRVATDDFAERIGRGGYGSVFKGVLADGTRVAVKCLDKLDKGKKAVLTEVETIGNLQHSNLLRLIGFCSEKSYKVLVYEYMSNGSLDTWIFQNDQRPFLDWQTRKKIILDIAKGLAHLHEECRQTIIHFDIKPQNILLGPNFNARISDFGLSKVIDEGTGQVQVSMRGTPGYIAPELCKLPPGRITEKIDIYSFGIVLLEIVCARKNIDHSLPESDFHLVRMLQNKAEEYRLLDIVENVDECMQSDKEEMLRMIKIGAWWLQDDQKEGLSCQRL
jgi:serine/threonine protein kinase